MSDAELQPTGPIPESASDFWEKEIDPVKYEAGCKKVSYTFKDINLDNPQEVVGNVLNLLHIVDRDVLELARAAIRSRREEAATNQKATDSPTATYSQSSAYRDMATVCCLHAVYSKIQGQSLDYVKGYQILSEQFILLADMEVS